MDNTLSVRDVVKIQVEGMSLNLPPAATTAPSRFGRNSGLVRCGQTLSMGFVGSIITQYDGGSPAL